MNRIVTLHDIAEAHKELKAIGVDPAGIELMRPKAVFRALKIKELRPVAANIIKQEMLSVGGEAATTHGSIDQSVEKTDVLLFGTLKHLKCLISKMKRHQFGLPILANDLEVILFNYDSIPKPMPIGNKLFDFSERTFVMGILNVTPDSFSDGGKYSTTDLAVKHAQQMLRDGADIIDIGGESTRPGSCPVSLEEEIKRVIPVIKKIVQSTPAVVSIDTTKAEVARQAIAAGAVMVNDISGLRKDANMAKVIAESKVPVCLMHIKGTPKDMQVNPIYSDVMDEISDYLLEGLAIAKRAGILHEKLIVDPGVGFGKTVEQNLEIVNKLRELKVLGCPLLIGPSRKSVIGKILDLPVEDRVEGTAALVALSIVNGANLVRVHDIVQMQRVIKMVDAILRRK